MPDFRQRSRQEEIMDDFDKGGYDLEQSLRELAFINKWSGGEHVLTDALNKLKPLLHKFDYPVKILDVACGDGDLLKKAGEWTSRHNIPAQLEGVDANPHVISYAKRQTQNPAIQYGTEDVFSSNFRERTFDVALLTLFCHHLKDEALIPFLNQLAGQTSTAIIINDLHRHPIPFYFTKIIASLFSKTPMVKHDGPVSVLRGFKKHDLSRVLHEAGIKNFRIKWFWAFRWQVLITLDKS